jgi:hypothetical protein
MLIRCNLGWRTWDHASMLIKALSCSKRDGIEFYNIMIIQDDRFRVRLLCAMTESDELILKSEKVWFEFR